MDPSAVLRHVQDLSVYYKPNTKIRNDIAQVLKDLYDLAKQNDLEDAKNNGLDKLLIKGFDEEQIWSQIEEYHTPLRSVLQKRIKETKNLIAEDDFDILIEGMFDAPAKGQQDDDEEMPDQPIEKPKAATTTTKKNVNMPHSKEGDELGRKFFSRTYKEDVHEFIDDMEQDLDNMDEDEVNEEDALAELYGDEDDDDDDDDLPKKPTNGKKSIFEQHQDSMLEEIEQLENQNIDAKPWQLQGEVGKFERPMNSLLNEDLSFDHTGKAKPVITEEVTKDLESIIMNRIVSGIFDDPTPPKQDDGEQIRKQMEVKQEKSQKSLAEIYEEEYLKRVEGVNLQDEENEQVKLSKINVAAKVSKLLHTLNMMSSFNYVSAPPVPEVLVANSKAVPSIQMEEAVPINVSDGTLQAPQDIMKPIETIIPGESEKTAEDRKLHRKRRKEGQKEKHDKAKDLVEKLKPGQHHKDKLGDMNKPKTFARSKEFFNLVQQNIDKYSDGKKKNQDKQQTTVEDADLQAKRHKALLKKL